MENWHRVILRPTDTIETSIGVLNIEKPRIVLVANDENILLGTVTDGDIRRALLKHLPLSTHIENIMCSSPKTALKINTKGEILSMMKTLSLNQIPIVDDDGKLIGIETLHNVLEINTKKENMVLIMAGGFGMRLHPLTENTPKPLLKVGEKPILEVIINRFIDFGFLNFTISLHYRADQIKEYFGDGSKWGINIKYFYEDKPLGTAGALGFIDSSKLTNPIVVMNGDILTDVDFDKLMKHHTDHSGAATICVREYDFQVPYGVIESKDFHVKGLVEKPTHKFFVNAGIYILNPEVISYVEKNQTIDMPNLIEKIISNNKAVRMFPLHEYWIDIGQVSQFNQANYDMDN